MGKFLVKIIPPYKQVERETITDKDNFIVVVADIPLILRMYTMKK